MTTQVKALIIVVLIAVIGIGAYVLSADSTDTVSPTTTSQPPAESSPEADSSNDTTNAASLTSNDVAEHNKADDCWTIINGSVYDITKYIPRHPGGDEILLACGTDGTSLFTTRTSDSGEAIGSGTPHSSNASRQLESYLLGTLEQ